ncbi:MAG: ABC transporter permease [Planctomycetes bacterium]|nr:ABC transporter permease [Planctomycetota bacterium]
MTIENFALIMIGFGAIIGVITLIYVLKRAFSRQAGELGGWEMAGARQIITAVAKTAVAEGLRTRIASGFVMLVVASVPFFYLTAEGDGTIKGKVQMFMTYSLGFSGFLLALLSILFACRSLSNEISGRQIFGIVSKPVPRWQILIGKFAGVMILNMLLLTYVGVTTYIGTLALVGGFKSNLHDELITYGSFTPAQAAAAVESLENVRGMGKEGMESPIIAAISNATGLPQQKIGETLLRLPEATRADLRRFDELRRQVLIARATIKPEIPEKQIRAEVEKRLAKMQEDGTLPSHMTERQVREELDKQMFGYFATIAPFDSQGWILKGPPPPKGEELIMSVRYKMHVPQVIPAINHPQTGAKLEEDMVLCIWAIGNPQSAHYYESVEPVPARTVQEMEFPVDAVEADGTIRIEFGNIDPRRVDVVFDVVKDALQVLYVVGSFELNLFMACIAMLVPLASLTAFGVCASTFLSFPVGALLVICLYLISSSMDFVKEAMAVTEDYMPDTVTTDILVRKTVVDSIGWLLSIGDIQVTERLLDGRVVGWTDLWADVWRYLLLKSGATLMIGVLVFRRRELAAIIV